jgi:hypothetical protein
VREPARVEPADADQHRGVVHGRGAMVGDSLARDIDGALDAGLDAVWINRFGQPGPGRDGVPEIASLTELPAALQTARCRRAACRSAGALTPRSPRRP